jgi:hypothetical protein
MTQSKTMKIDIPFRDEAGELIPCWRCGRNDGLLVGRKTSAWALDNLRETTDGDGKKRWTIQQTPGEDGDLTPALKEIVLKVQNYHRECDNIYTRNLRQSKNTRIKTVEDRLDRLQDLLTEVVLKSRVAPPPYTPPPVVPRVPRQVQPPPQQERLPYDSVYSRLQPPPPVNYSAYRIDPQSDAGSDANTMAIQTTHELNELQLELEIFDKHMKNNLTEDNEVELNAKRADILARMNDAMVRQRKYITLARGQGPKSWPPVSSSDSEQDNNH